MRMLCLQNTPKITHGSISTLHMPKSFIRPCNSRHENPLTQCSYFFFFRPAFSSSVPVQALIFSLNVSNFAGGVHGHQAIVSFLSQVTMVDHGALPWSTLNNVLTRLSASVSRAHAPGRGVEAARTAWSSPRTLGFFARLGLLPNLGLAICLW